MFLERFQDKLAVALEHAGRTHTPEDVRYLIAQHRLQVWVTDDSLLLTEIADFPSCRALHHFCAVGKLSDILTLREQALAWAKDKGCTLEIVTGRPGWVKVAQRRHENWNPPQIQMTREME